MYSTCKYYDVCDSNDMGPVVLNNHSTAFPEGFWVNTSLVGAKIVKGSTPANDINNICFGTKLAPVWDSYLQNDIHDALTWQYLGTGLGSFIYHPLGNYTAGCPGTYDPRKRPWYVSAVTGPMNLYIMIDNSNSAGVGTRVQRAVDIALGILDALSLWSFFNIGVYSSSTRMWSTTLVRASSGNVEAGREFLRSLKPANSSFVGVEDSLVNLFANLESSTASSASSQCHNVIVYLGGTKNDFAYTDINTVVEKNRPRNSKTVVFSYVLNFYDVAAITPVYRDMACLNEGLYVVLTSQSSDAISDVIRSFTAYFGSAVNNNKVRFSEIYTDNLGLGDILTGVKSVYTTAQKDANSPEVPVLAGVYGADLLVSKLNDGGGISHDAIHAFLSSSQECPQLQASEDVLDYLRGDGSGCLALSGNSDYGSGGDLFLDKHKASYETLGAFCFLFVVVLFPVAFYLLDGRKARTREFAVMQTGVSLLVFIPCGIALLVYVLSSHWHDTVVVYNYRQADMTVLETVVEERRCCRITDCACAEAASNVPTCSSKMASLLEGSCNNGYYCCQTQCYSCNCHENSDGNQECDQCCYCSLSVAARSCNVECSTCYTGICYVPL
jgi:hypothetical protein